ncbi:MULTISPECIES: hypothetical protein [unclassified Haladaptatus]|uniref:DUF7470 family protein n=1 Tax=unclassified Haladaptatus TaxID=2622732 RepID=UPI0023E77FCC|nr:MULTISPECIES: hypothetical protein [unclassified Haladaptatus]
MLDKLGTGGLVGLLLLVVGLGVIAYANPLVAAGLALVLAGVGLVAKGLVSGMLSAFGMGEMF